MTWKFIWNIEIWIAFTDNCLFISIIYAYIEVCRLNPYMDAFWSLLSIHLSRKRVLASANLWVTGVLPYRLSHMNLSSLHLQRKPYQLKIEMAGWPGVMRPVTACGRWNQKDWELMKVIWLQGWWGQPGQCEPASNLLLTPHLHKKKKEMEKYNCWSWFLL